MRIGFVTIGFQPLRTSGLDVSGERLVSGLLAAGNEVHVVAGRTNPLQEVHHHPRLQIHRLALGPSHWLGFGWRAAHHLQRLRQTHSFDVVHFWDAYFGYACAAPFVASLQHSFRQRWQAWDRRPGRSLRSTYRWAYYTLAWLLAERPTVRRASGLLASSQSARNELVQHFGVAPERIALARHGIDTQFFRPCDSRPLREELRLASDVPVVLFVGFVTPRKGLEYLAEALTQMQPRPKLIIAGRWSQTARAQFRQRLGSAANAVIEAGFVPDERLPEYYSLADVYVSASMLEGFGLPLAEALACETPVVTPGGGAVDEVVGPGGVLVAPADASALAKAVSALLQSPGQRRSLGQQGRQHIVANFDVERMCQDTLAAYERFARPG